MLVVPKTLVDVLWDAPADTLSALLNFAQPIAKAIQQAVPCNRCGMAVLGLDVPHAHLHLVPVNSAADLDFTQTRKKAAPEALAAMQSLLLSALRNKQ